MLDVNADSRISIKKYAKLNKSMNERIAIYRKSIAEAILINASNKRKHSSRTWKNY